MTKPDETLVLVADDEPSTLALVSARLRARGYRVLEASDGDQAWELAYENLPSLVLLDVMMPGMSGWEVCRKIREAVSLAHTGIIMLTGIGETLNETTSPLFGADAYIDKPFEFSDLDQKIQQTLASRRQGTFGRPDHADEEDADVVTSVYAEDLNSEPPLNGAAGPARAERPQKAKPAQKPAATKPSPSAAKKAAAKKAASKSAQKATAKKAPAKKAPAKKATAKKALKKAAAKKAPAKKAPKKAAAKKATAKKAPAAKKATAKKAPPKKATARRAPAGNPAPKKAPAKTNPAKKSANPASAAHAPSTKVAGKKAPAKQAQGKHASPSVKTSAKKAPSKKAAPEPPAVD